MGIQDSLSLLDKSRLFEVKRENDGYEVVFKNDTSEYPLSAVYTESDGWFYYIEGVYNNGSNWVRVEIIRLMALKDFCESLGSDA